MNVQAVVRDANARRCALADYRHGLAETLELAEYAQREGFETTARQLIAGGWILWRAFCAERDDPPPVYER